MIKLDKILYLCCDINHNIGVEADIKNLVLCKPQDPLLVDFHLLLMGFLFKNIMEIWKTINGFEDYQISNYGRVKSFKLNKERILKHGLSSNYYVVGLCNNYGLKTKQVHQLVAIAFLNHIPCGHKMVINHKDFNKLNNHVDNLEIVTNRENTNLKHIKSSSGYIGVYLFKRDSKWYARILIKGKRIHLGVFNNEYDANLAYQNKLKENII